VLPRSSPKEESAKIKQQQTKKKERERDLRIKTEKRNNKIIFFQFSGKKNYVDCDDGRFGEVDCFHLQGKTNQEKQLFLDLT